MRHSSSDYVLVSNEGKLESYYDVLNRIKTMHDETNSLKKNNRSFDLVELLKGRKTLKNKWVFKLKQGDGNLVNHKAILVVKGFVKKGIDFDEIFSPVMKMNSIQVILGLASSLNLEIE